MKKENLVLVASFPTNRHILKGLVTFLERRFNVFFIDLPGFVAEIPALPAVSLKEYGRYVERSIERLGLETYILGGISFGFYLCTLFTPDRRCKGYLALEPFLGVQSLELNVAKKWLTAFLTQAMGKREEERIWRTGLFRRLLQTQLCPAAHIEATLQHIDPHAFFSTLKLLLTAEDPQTPFLLPVCLIVNKEDNVVSTPYVERALRERAQRLLVFKTTMEHYPTTIDEAYFAQHIRPDMLDETIAFFNARRPGKRGKSTIKGTCKSTDPE